MTPEKLQEVLDAIGRLDLERDEVQQRVELRAILQALLEKTRGRSESPGFVLANYLHACLNAYEDAVIARDAWYGIGPGPRAGGDDRR